MHALSGDEASRLELLEEQECHERLLPFTLTQSRMHMPWRQIELEKQGNILQCAACDNTQGKNCTTTPDYDYHGVQP